MKTVKELLDNTPALQNLVSQKMPIATAYKLGKLVKECDTVLELFEGHKKDLFEKFGNPVDGEEDKIEIPKDNIESFSKAIDVYLNEEIEITIPEIKISEMGDIEIEPSVLASLEWLIKE